MHNISLQNALLLFIAVTLPINVFSQDKQEFPVLKGAYLGQKTPGAIPEIFTEGIFPPDFKMYYPSFTPDGKELYFDTNIDGKLTIMKMSCKNGIWSKPEPVSFNTEYDDGELNLSPDGKKLFFINKRPLSEGKPPPEFWNIWVAEREKGGWKLPVPLSKSINTDSMEAYPSVSSPGILYFSSNRNDGSDGWDIYRSEFINSEYGNPVKLGNSINSKYNDWDSFVAPDESYMIFCSENRPDGFGGSDMYVSFKNLDGDWIPAKNLGKTVNSKSGEFCPSITPDGKYLFFHRNGKVFWVKSSILNKLK